MTRISIHNPRRERLKGYYRLKLRRAGRRLGRALARTVLPPERLKVPNIDGAPMRYWWPNPLHEGGMRGGDSWVLEMLAPRYWEAKPLPRFDLSDIPGSASDHIHYWDVKWGDTRDDER